MEGGLGVDNSIENILITEEQISKKILALSEIINSDYKDKKLYVLSLLRGSFIFTADLVRHINVPTAIGFMTTSSYGNGESTSGKVKVVQDITENLEGYDVLVVDDIVDTGTTMSFIMNYLKKYNPASIKCCVLLDKPSRRKVTLVPDYCCFTIPDLFVVGYGLNYGDYFRNKPYIFNWES